MSRWPIRVRRLRIPEIILTKVQSGQSPGAVAHGYEKEVINNLWIDQANDRLYEERGDNFIFVKTKSLAELIKETKTLAGGQE